MKKMIQKIREKKGFTLAELLIVVAIIAVLVAIAIPIFTTQLEKSREATDMANIRSAYAVISAAALTEDDETTLQKNNTPGIAYTKPADGTYQAVVTLKQQTNDWQSANHDLPGTISGTPSKGGNATVKYTSSDNKVTITFGT